MTLADFFSRSGRSLPHASLPLRPISHSMLADMGKKIPDDIAVTGFDDIIQDLNYIPRLTTIKQPFTEKGKSAMQLLADIIGNKVKGPVKQEVEFSLVARESA